MTDDDSLWKLARRCALLSAGVGVGAILLRSLARRNAAGSQIRKPALTAEAAQIESGVSEAQAKLAGISLRCNAVTVTLLEKKQRSENEGNRKRILLDSTRVEIYPGTVTAIMGPSGGGKTTLLNILAGRLQYDKNIQAYGEVTVSIDGRPLNGRVDMVRGQQGYVMQEDVFLSQQTVRETLETAIRLRLIVNRPHTRYRSETVSKHVDALLEALDLTHVQGTVVGGGRQRGISGGERKRLSIACELIRFTAAGTENLDTTISCGLLFLDEPTTGLDANSSLQVMRALRKLADKCNVTVVVTIHQPREQVYEMLDTLVLLSSRGRLVFSGPRDAVAEHLERQGLPIPPRCNPADYLLDVASGERFRGVQEPASDPMCPRFGEVDKEAAEIGLDYGPIVNNMNALNTFNAWMLQFRILLGRNVKQLLRDRKALLVRGFTTLTTSVIFGVLYWRLGEKLTYAGMQSRQGLVQVLVNYVTFTTLAKTCAAYGQERVLVARELSNELYSVVPYVLAKACSELPYAATFPAIVGAVVHPAAKMQRFGYFSSLMVLMGFSYASYGLALGSALPGTAALEMGRFTMMFSIICGGNYFTRETLPWGMKWMADASLIKKSLNAMVANDMQGLTFHVGEDLKPLTGEAVLIQSGILRPGDGANAAKAVVVSGIAHETRMIGLYFAVTLLSLSWNRPRFVDLRSHLDDEGKVAKAPQSA